MPKSFLFPEMRNRELQFEPETRYARAAAPCAAASSTLQFPTWCRILEIARTSRAAGGGGGGAAHPASKMPNAAKPLCSKTAKEPGEKHRRKPFSLGAGKARAESISGKRKLFVIQFQGKMSL